MPCLTTSHKIPIYIADPESFHISRSGLSMVLGVAAASAGSPYAVAGQRLNWMIQLQREHASVPH